MGHVTVGGGQLLAYMSAVGGAELLVHNCCPTALCPRYVPRSWGRKGCITRRARDRAYLRDTSGAIGCARRTPHRVPHRTAATLHHRTWIYLVCGAGVRSAYDRRAWISSLGCPTGPHWRIPCPCHLSSDNLAASRGSGSGQGLT